MKSGKRLRNGLDLSPDNLLFPKLLKNSICDQYLYFTGHQDLDGQAQEEGQNMISKNLFLEGTCFVMST